MRSVQLQTHLCVSPSCHLPSEVICRHCSQQYCQLCYMCHRKNILDDMKSIGEQMKTNRRQGVNEVVSFIDKQAKDAHDQAKKLVDDAIDRIIKASTNIYSYIENRRQAKLGRLGECLEKFDQDAELLNSKLNEQVFLPAETMSDLRRKYAYNMFDSMSSPVDTRQNKVQSVNEKFFDDYRHYHELVNLRQKWTFLQAALTTVYFPAKKDISLDKILTFLEYRHDRVLENYREHLSNSDDSKELSLKPAEDLLHELSFLSRKKFPEDEENFSRIQPSLIEVQVEKHQPPSNIVCKPESEITPKTDSGHGEEDNHEIDDDDTESSQSWEIEDAIDYEGYDARFVQLSQSMKTLEKQFENDFRPFLNNDQYK